MDLNLLPSSAKFQAAKIRLQKKVNQVIIYLLAAWVLAIAVLFSLGFWGKTMVNAATEKQQKANRSYKTLEESVATSQNLKYEAKMVGGVLHKRFEYGKSFEMIQELFGEGISLDKYELQEEMNFKINGSTVGRQNVDRVERIVEDINAGEKEGLKSARITSLAVSKDKWVFGMEVAIK